MQKNLCKLWPVESSSISPLLTANTLRPGTQKVVVVGGTKIISHNSFPNTHGPIRATCANMTVFSTLCAGQVKHYTNYSCQLSSDEAYRALKQSPLSIKECLCTWHFTMLDLTSYPCFLHLGESKDNKSFNRIRDIPPRYNIHYSYEHIYISCSTRSMQNSIWWHIGFVHIVNPSAFQ